VSGPESDRQWTFDPVIRGVLAALAIAAAAIHTAVIREHVEEFWLYGAFFVVVAALQFLWGVAVLTRRSRRTLVAGGIGSAAIALAWIVSRTVGIPIGPGGGGREPVGALDLVSTGFEVAVVVGVLVLVRSRVGSITLPRPRALAWTATAWLLIVVGTASALVLAPGTEADERVGTGSSVGSVVRPHLVHVVMFGVAVAAVVVYWIIDRRRMRAGRTARGTT
jgi:hypothetical protein